MTFQNLNIPSFFYYEVSEKGRQEKKLLSQIQKWSFQQKQLTVQEIITLHLTVDLILECAWCVK